MLSQKTIEIIKSTVPVLEVKGTEITTVFYKNLFESHPELLNIFNHANQKRGRQQTALANTVLAAATYIDNLETILPVVKQIAHKHRSLVIKPEHYPIVGQHLLGAIKQVLGEAATDDIINSWGEAYGVIAQVFIDIEKEMYQEAVSQENGWAEYKNFKVVDKVKESEVITSFYLKPADGSAVPSFLPGQYITIRLEIPGEEYLFNRQYSLSVSPGKEYYRISVKREAEGTSPDGNVSNYLHDHINTGDVLEVTAPAGVFTLDAQSLSPVVFISGGVGITPFMSMANAIAEANPERQVQFIHAVRSGKVQAFKNELEALKNTMKNLELSYVYEQPTEQDRKELFFAKDGFIDAEWLQDYITDREADYFVCGPVLFLRAIVGSLKKLGVEDTHIHFEFFGPAASLEA
ncbi:NO-inducible flavohemoprotein [Bacillus sp. V5-8f]|uniref:NO-inducible flavohemoprotein n=1 Tax=Bacillus sp. V5-8f TaxID=2053044 RepID=UPI000C7609A9|nr:NO-inducible flavohemoprotein [Bacillus sp. V5-8f]PLT34932.1 NO-inducible flavohemoprotein [Bacillus sp. V5-8f]